MPLKLNVGLSKKVGLPDYGSLGASCHVEVELVHDRERAVALGDAGEAHHRLVRGEHAAGGHRTSPLRRRSQRSTC